MSTSSLVLDPFADLGALLAFEPAGPGQSTIVLVRSGVSLISADQACSNAEEEIPNFDFDAVARSAREEWNELLGRIQVTVVDGQEDTRELFYSSVRVILDECGPSTYILCLTALSFAH